ncbi:uncharacterized protein VTP21DRAFT_10891 [Calcarisporiella thermophila]|uniref:uncharacterized protein n=1 Tax=Calcarisporiella thermophila TaxID=911321 RepID=UPI0037428A13
MHSQHYREVQWQWIWYKTSFPFWEMPRDEDPIGSPTFTHFMAAALITLLLSLSSSTIEAKWVMIVLLLFCYQDA